MDSAPMTLLVLMLAAREILPIKVRMSLPERVERSLTKKKPYYPPWKGL